MSGQRYKRVNGFSDMGPEWDMGEFDKALVRSICETRRVSATLRPFWISLVISGVLAFALVLIVSATL